MRGAGHVLQSTRDMPLCTELFTQAVCRKRIIGSDFILSFKPSRLFVMSVLQT